MNYVDIKCNKKYDIILILSSHKTLRFSIIFIIASLIQQFIYCRYVLGTRLTDS